ncbi:hypothetical protein F5I97DRAFT_1069168 [Phlebopus sp. FC_14]|nr:hypothetical protein F5I97DRAFT_1069168 [Phlebopus sp. FC_14]
MSFLCIDDINDNESLDDSLSFLSDESDTLQTPPRSPSRLDFCTSSGDEREISTELHCEDVACLESAPRRIDWTFGLFGGARSREICTEENEEDVVQNTSADAPAPRNDTNYCSGESDPSLEDDLSICHTPFPSTERPHRGPNVASCTPAPVRLMATGGHADPQESPHPSRTSAQRLNYPHHGLSRNALLHQKVFWNARQEEWREWQVRREQQQAHAKDFPLNANAACESADAGTRVACGPPPNARTPSSGLERDVQEYVPGGYVQDIGAPIYPRVGDISALRDPYSVNVDRCFFKFPLWTIHKTLYVFDMHQRSTFLKRTPPTGQGKGIPGSPSASSLRSDESASSGDEDSDVTLVADDSDGTKCVLSQEDLSYTSPPLSPTPYLWNGVRTWELSWYARWELLIGLVQRDQAIRHTCEAPHHAPTRPSDANSVAPVKFQLLSRPKPTFRFAGEDGDDDSADEEEDYGTLVTNPVYSKDFENGYQRAMQFFSRESR